MPMSRRRKVPERGYDEARDVQRLGPPIAPGAATSELVRAIFQKLAAGAPLEPCQQFTAERALAIRALMDTYGWPLPSQAGVEARSAEPPSSGRPAHRPTM